MRQSSRHVTRTHIILIPLFVFVEQKRENDFMSTIFIATSCSCQIMFGLMCRSGFCVACVCVHLFVSVCLCARVRACVKQRNRDGNENEKNTVEFDEGETFFSILYLLFSLC